jgi:hypothetical protein
MGDRSATGPRLSWLLSENLATDGQGVEITLIIFNVTTYLVMATRTKAGSPCLKMILLILQVLVLDLHSVMLTSKRARNLSFLIPQA